MEERQVNIWVSDSFVKANNPPLNACAWWFTAVRYELVLENVVRRSDGFLSFYKINKDD